MVYTNILWCNKHTGGSNVSLCNNHVLSWLDVNSCNNFGLWIFMIAQNTHTHPFYGPFSRTTRVSRYQKGKTNLDFTEARDSEWQWHQLDHMQVCTSLQTDNHASNPPLSFLQAGCPSCRPTNSVKALKGKHKKHILFFHIYLISAVQTCEIR